MFQESYNDCDLRCCSDGRVDGSRDDSIAGHNVMFATKFGGVKGLFEIKTDIYRSVDLYILSHVLNESPANYVTAMNILMKIHSK